jgi:hypothetical protein
MAWFAIIGFSWSSDFAITIGLHMEASIAFFCMGTLTTLGSLVVEPNHGK